MREHIDTWLLPPLDSPRALSPAALAEKLAAHGARDVRQRDSLVKPGAWPRRWPAKMIELLSLVRFTPWPG